MVDSTIEWRTIRVSDVEIKAATLFDSGTLKTTASIDWKFELLIICHIGETSARRLVKRSYRTEAAAIKAAELWYKQNREVFRTLQNEKRDVL